MKTITYHGLDGKDFTEEYDENAPCIVCGEPVVSASMGGTAVCPWCDLGKCRYCHMPIFVFKESIDDGRSKKELLDHMKWHREHPVLQQWQKDLIEKVMDNKDSEMRLQKKGDQWE